MDWKGILAFVTALSRLAPLLHREWSKWQMRKEMGPIKKDIKKRVKEHEKVIEDTVLNKDLSDAEKNKIINDSFRDQFINK